MHVCGNFGCMHADFGCISIKHLGACMRKRLGAKYADVGCTVCGCWVQVYGTVGLGNLLRF